MLCPLIQCDGTTSKVVKTRFSEDQAIKSRRRKCSACGYLFTTEEKIKGVKREN